MLQQTSNGSLISSSSNSQQQLFVGAESLKRQSSAEKSAQCPDESFVGPPALFFCATDAKGTAAGIESFILSGHARVDRCQRPVTDRFAGREQRMDRVGAVPAAGVPPPAPPPPPAQLGPTKILGTGGRPSANRQHIVGVPSTQPPVVPSQERSQPFAGVHPETLQHAAARLRPTQHRESLFPPERQQFLDGQDLLASGRHWADQPQHDALAKHSSGTTLYASSPYPNQPAALRFDAAHRDSLNASPSAVGQQQHHQQYHHSQPQPHYFPHRPSPSSNSPSPHLPYSSSSSSYAFNSSSSPFSSNVPVKEVPIQMVGSQYGTPYSAATKFGSPSPDLIAEPRRHIHAYATQTPVSALMETTPEASSTTSPKWAPNGAGHWQRRVPKGAAATGGDFARELRDAALTERQRAANLQQKSALKQPYSSQLPSSLHNYAYQQTVSSTTTTTSKNANKNGGQAVDELIRDMETKMRNTTNTTSKVILHRPIRSIP
uniref:LIM zinc-binding domain-containing protein n=1 Tax=Globodera rostochiensis TaxID=31243 RepID=A0A914HFZ7_GLORO